MSRWATVLRGRQTSKAVIESDEEQMEESNESPMKKIATDQKKKRGNSGTKTTKRAINKPPIMRKRKASKVDESDAEDATKAALQKAYSEIAGNLIPAFGTTRYSKAYYENAMQTDQWEKLTYIVTRKRIGLENQVAEWKIEVDYWKNKYEQLQQKVDESAEIFKRGLDKCSESMDIFERGLDNLVALFSSCEYDESSYE